MQVMGTLSGEQHVHARRIIRLEMYYMMAMGILTEQLTTARCFSSAGFACEIQKTQQLSTSL